jgi:hypothetical protein
MSALSHLKYTNSAFQEMANPKVHPHLRFYPEDSKNHLSEARQGRCWLYEMDNDQLTPMARLGRQDYYIYEPCMLRNGDCCIPVRWFTVGDMLFAKCWKMKAVASDTGSGWRVVMCNDYSVIHSDFLKTFPDLCEDAKRYGFPHPSILFGVSSLLLFNYSNR